MKKVMMNLCVIASLIFMASCSSDDSSDGGGGGEPSDEPLSGTVSGQDFTPEGMRATLDSGFGDDKISIQLSGEDIGCETSVFSTKYTVEIIAPREEGTFDSDVVINFGSAEEGDFASVASGNTIEIQSLGPDEVEFSLGMIGTDSNDLDGSLSVPICDADNQDG